MIDCSVQKSCCETFVDKYLKLLELENFCVFCFFFGSPSSSRWSARNITRFTQIKYEKRENNGNENLLRTWSRVYSVLYGNS